MYVVEYIRLWILVTINRPEVKRINFIDCMCNAGIYKDGDLCTSLEVLSVFYEYAQSFPEKSFCLFLNDSDASRISICKMVKEKLYEKQNVSNVSISLSCLDVNDYLMDYTQFDKALGYSSASVLFVDPYDFGTVIIDNLKAFICRYYCEVIFNFFISDFVRNGIDARIRNCIGNVEIRNKDELIGFIAQSLKTGKMKYVFMYKFKTSKNTELYQIIFATPNILGLTKLKEALWKSFNGKFYHKNNYVNPAQQTFISGDIERQLLLSAHANEAKELVLSRYPGQKVSYREIESFLIENTMIQASDVIKSILKPLIDNGGVRKEGIPQNKNNYKDDYYTIYGVLK